MTAVGKLLVAALAVTILYSTVRVWLPAWAPVIAVAGAGAVLAILSASAGNALRGQLALIQQAAGTEAFKCLFKSAGILLVADYSKNMCRDAGLSAMGVCVDFCGRCLVLLAAWPILSGVLQTVQALTG